jgi:uncharacterized protein YjiS (DUF1127 family)
MLRLFVHDERVRRPIPLQACALVPSRLTAQYEVHWLRGSCRQCGQQRQKPLGRLRPWDIHALGVAENIKIYSTLSREPLTGLQACVDYQLCNLVKSPSETRANRNKCHIIFSRDNGITKFRFSVWSASPICIHMLRDTTSPQSKMTGVVAQAAFKLVSGIRLMARFVSCYVQTHHERNELSRLSYRSLRDIGLTTHDVEEMLLRPDLHRCWRAVNLCE